MPELLVEIGCEELPSVACLEAERQAPDLLSRSLSAAGLDGSSPRVHVGPRRIALIATVPVERPAAASEVRGPRADAPDQAREGFARKHGLSADQLERRDDGFLWAVSAGTATPARELVPEVVKRIVDGFQFSKTMRWPGGRFSRPIRWLVVKLDGDVVDVECAGVPSGDHSQGHRSRGAVRIGSAATYLDDLRGVHVIADAGERRSLIDEGLGQTGEWIDPMGKLAEVTYLVEWPVVLEGRFDERYLELPDRLAVTVMQSHQRYFPIVAAGRLDARFAFVANGGVPEVVVAGNEEVLVGRLEDGAFAYGKDRDRGIGPMLAELPRVSFLEGAGSLAQKSERVREVSGQLCDRVEVDPDVRAAVGRAAELCKADLVSSLVAEFSDLQGYAGSVYAAEAGEPPAVCRAVEEHHMPVEAGGTLPASVEGGLLSIADKADTIAVAFALGAQPTGSRDPYGLRRAAAGIVAIALDRGYELGLVDLMAESVHMLVAQGHELKRKPLEAVPDAVDFVLDRVEPVMLEEGVTVEEIRAARGSGVTGPLPLAALSRALRDARGSERLAMVRDAYGRCVRITARSADEAASELRTSLFEMDEERALCAALGGADIEIADAAAQRDYGSALDAARGLVDPINEFFDKVMVMAEDPAVRGNRLKLLLDVASTLRLVGDFDQLPG
ncbi:MAG TPA: glycine--tRNA ligase subunit beta [Gaiellales bacterium]|nr:glycine--tRNA ligase subunit beta [Gaiellales bacterium]